jgi:hypothetical protein
MRRYITRTLNPKTPTLIMCFIKRQQIVLLFNITLYFCISYIKFKDLDCRNVEF